MSKLTMSDYQQMGYSTDQVRKAQAYAQKNKVDIFDALQYIQRQQSEPQIKNAQTGQTSETKQQSSLKSVSSSLLIPFKKVNLSNYQTLYSKKSSRLSLSIKKLQIRQQNNPVGLLNVYNCCYLNSLLQCYFLSTDLIKYVFQAEPLASLQHLYDKNNPQKTKRIQNLYNLLFTFKDIFGRMTLTSKKYIDPTDVLKSLVNQVGDKIQFGQEKDLFQTNILIIQRLNQCVLFSKKYYKSSETQIKNGKQLFNINESTIKQKMSVSKINQHDKIKRLFYGTKVQTTQNPKSNIVSQQITSQFLGIILNPMHQTLYKALYQQFHYQVQIESQSQKVNKLKKHIYIKQVPQYLYFYINRTSFNIKQGAKKNQQKLSFEFIIYLDRFMNKYKQYHKSNIDEIDRLWDMKNKITKKQNNFQIFTKKLQQCRIHAQTINGWLQKLPKNQQIEQQKAHIIKQLEQIQKQLQKVESRKEIFHLMFIFVHRGDAVSGHYWGYGQNQSNWFRFDINVKPIKQSQILLDLYKSGGTPYALVYVKQANLPNFNYKHYYHFDHLVKTQSLLDIQDQKQNYFDMIDTGMKKVIISQNVQIHQQYNKKRNTQITTKTVQQYLTQFSWLNSQIQEFNTKNKKPRFPNLPQYENFALYLLSRKQVELAKYNIFVNSFKIASNMDIESLKSDQMLLRMIQKQFRKKINNNKMLKYFYIQAQQQLKYSNLLVEFSIEKYLFNMVFKLFKLFQAVQKSITQLYTNINKQQPDINKLNVNKQVEVNEDKQVLVNDNKQVKVDDHKQVEVDENKKVNINKQIAIQIENYLKIYFKLKNIISDRTTYINHILNQLISMFLLKLSQSKIKLKLNPNQLKYITNEKLLKQINILRNNQSLFCIEQKNITFYQLKDILKQNKQEFWSLQSIGKTPNRSLLNKRTQQIVQKLKKQIIIYRKISKQNTFCVINSKTGQIQIYDQKPIIHQDLI